MQTTLDALAVSNFIPHGFCLSWEPVLLWLHIVSDAITTVSYYSIPCCILYFLRKRRDMPYSWLFFLVALFIVACGTTHLFSIVLIWWPLYWIDGFLKAVTAIISFITALAMLRVVPKALHLIHLSTLQTELEIQEKIQTIKQEATERLDKIANQLPCVVFQFKMNTDGSFCTPYSNETLRLTYQLSPEEIRFDSSLLFTMVHPDDRDAYLEKLFSSAKKLTHWEDEYRLKFMDGTERWLWGRSIPQREEDGAILWHGFTMDITERKQAEEKLQKSETRLNEAERIAQIGNWELDLTTQIFTCSAGFFRIVEKDLAINATYDTFLNVIHPDDKTLVENTYQQSLKSRLPSAITYRLLLPDGRIKYVRQQFEHYYNAQGDAVRSIGTIQDITAIKHIESALRASEQRLTEIINLMPIAVLIKDAQSRILMMNNICEEQWGVKLDDIQYTTGSHIFSADKMSSILADDRKIFSEKKLFETEERIWNVGLQGNRIIHTYKKPVFDELDHPNYMIVIAVDITRAKEQENEIKESEIRFRTIIDVSPVPIVLNDPDANILFVNAAFSQTFGYDTSNLDELHHWWSNQHLLPQTLDKTNADLPHDFKEATPPVEFKLYAKNGQPKIVLVSTNSIFQFSKKEYLVVLYDITQLKETQAQLSHERRQLQSIITGTNAGTWEWNVQTGNVSINERWANILGYTLAELQPTHIDTWQRLCHPDDLKRSSDMIADHFAGKLSYYDCECRMKHKNGHWVWVLDRGRLISLNALGEPLIMAGAHIDISEIKQIEAELLRSNKELEQFAYAVSHDMRQPLRMISSYLSMLELSLKGTLNQEQQQFVAFAVEGAKRMDSMILSLLDYSRIGRTAPAAQISSKNALDEALNFLQFEIKTNQGTIDVSGEWIDIYACHDELVRLLQNLIGNALKYHDKQTQPRVHVHALVVDHWFKVTVHDFGIGIHPMQIERLFKVFSRLQDRSHFEGTGVGLAICRKIVEHHGGKIGVESPGEGLGSTFWFELPLSPLKS